MMPSNAIELRNVNFVSVALDGRGKFRLGIRPTENVRQTHPFLSGGDEISTQIRIAAVPFRT